jgi:hypothetical protein
MSLKNFEKRFGQSPVFVASTLLENGGVPQSASSGALLKEAIHVISCGYEDKTEWGKEVMSRCPFTASPRLCFLLVGAVSHHSSHHLLQCPNFCN